MNEWKEVKLDEIGDVFSGGTPSTTNTELWDGNIAFVTPFDLSRNKTPYIKKTQRYISRKGLEQSSTNLLPANSLILSSRAPIGYIALSDIEFVTNQGCKSLKFFDTQEPLFHYYNLQMYVDEMKRYGVGTTFSEISKGDLSKLKIRIPKNNKDQLHIAKILFTCDTVIEQTQSAIAKYKAIKQGLLHGLFTRGLDGNGKLRPRYQEAPELYKESELGMIPKEWEVSIMNHLCELITDGSHFSPKPLEIGEIIANVKDMGEFGINYGGCTKISYKDFLTLKNQNCSPNKGDVLLSKDGTVGRVILFNDENLIVILSSIAILRPTSIIISEFLYGYLKSLYFNKQLLVKLSGSALKRIVLRDIKNLVVAYPSNKHEQQMISKRIIKIENKLKTEATLLQKYQSIKRGLMGDLLGGKKMMLHDE